MLASVWAVVADTISNAFSLSIQMPQPSKVVATVITLEDFRIAFLDTENFVDLPCWQSVTHIVVRDFLNIALADGEVCVAGLANRFGWVVYKSILQRLLDAHPHLTLILEFHEIIDRDLLYGSRKFPCCAVEDYLTHQFPTGNIGLCFRVMDYMSVVNLDGSLAASLKCLAANMGDRFSLWADIENKHFSLTASQFALFDGVFMHRNARLTADDKKRVVLKIEKPFIDARLAYVSYAGMMTVPLFKDGADAKLLPFDKARLDKLANPSMLNTCLKEWHSLAQLNPHGPCSRCALPNNVCVALSDAPGSCSSQTAQDALSSISSSTDEEVFVLE